jgi:hypothetical protein
MLSLPPLFSVDTYSFGLPGLDTRILSMVYFEQGVVMAPTDPWFFFSPMVLPGISTEWVRQYNLVPSKMRWFYWLAYDKPYDFFEWFPKWDPLSKRYYPLSASGYPVRIPSRNYPAWVVEAKDDMLKYFENDVDAVYQPSCIQHYAKA